MISRNYTSLALILVLFISAYSQETPDYTSKVPQYDFPNTLEAQEKALEDHPMIERFTKSRKELSSDPYRPVYHYVNPEGRLNDPNGLCFWQDKWHLFYQAYPPEDPRQHWGHAVSKDLIHWRDLPLAIYPDPEEKCFSGAALVEVDRVIAMYHGINQGNMVAVSSDPLLLNWEKVTGKAVIPLPEPGADVPYRIFDPCIFKQGGFYYSLSAGMPNTGPGGKRLRELYLFRSKDLATWEYMHPFLENDQYGLVGDDGACPYFWPIGDRHMLLHFSHMSGGKYIIGDYDTDRNKLVVTGGGDFNHGSAGPGGVHAPSAYPDGKGGIYVIFNMNPAKPTLGWNQIMSLPRHLSLNEKNELVMKPAGDIESLHFDRRKVEAMTLPANEEIVLENIKGNAMEINAEFEVNNASILEIKVLRSPDDEEYTRIGFYRDRGYRDWEKFPGWGKKGHSMNSVIVLDNSQSSTLPDVRSRPPEATNFYIQPDENLKFRIFIDKSIVEVFVNDRQCVASRVYPGKENSLGISLYSSGQDSKLISLDAYQMKSIWD